MGEVLKYRSPLYGFLALWIIVFHIESTVGLPWNIPVLSPLIQCGNICVDVFLFISGYCCCLSFKKNQDLFSFYKRRVIRVVIPYLILAVPFYLWKTITHYSAFSFGKRSLLFLTDIFGLSLWTNGVLTTWFVTAIILFYLVFPFVFYISSRTQSFIKAFIILALVYCFGIFIIHALFPGVYRKGCIAITRFPVFCLGSLCAFFPFLPNPNKRIALTSSILILLFLGIIPIRSILDSIHANREFYWFVYIVFTIPLVYCLYTFIRFTPPFFRRFLSFCGEISLELYLVHILIRNVLVWYSLTALLGYWFYLILPLVSIPIAYCVSVWANKFRQTLSID